MRLMGADTQMSSRFFSDINEGNDSQVNGRCKNFADWSMSSRGLTNTEIFDIGGNNRTTDLGYIC